MAEKILQNFFKKKLDRGKISRKREDEIRKNRPEQGGCQVRDGAVS